MCLGVPGRIVSVDGHAATVDFWGVQKTVLLHIVDALDGNVDVGDALVIFLKFASSVVPTIAFDATRAVRAI